MTTTYAAARQEIESLVTRFKNLKPSERKNLNEQATRLGYILPLFRALGWNIDDTHEVSPEEKVSRGWVDFSFRLGNVPKFFLETKRADEDLNDPRWVKQAIDYAWTKGVTWAVLSDFEEMRLFNAEWQEENPFKAEFIRFNVDSYLTDFDRLWWLSRDEINGGTLNREAEKVGKKTHREAVSQHLFDDLKAWRHDLFQQLHGYNKMYSPAQIDEAVLRILNRLLFVRTAEDREVEANRLLSLVRELKDQNKLNDLSKALAKLFREFDDTYNSELFARHFSEELYCEPTAYENLIQDLYEKRFVRYNFNAIDADVLGTAYEQYLGHVITDPEAAEVVEKKQKRKSQGIYYTPTFVTKYIVQQTLGRYLDEHGYDPSHPVRVLDMACGSGSFLLEAFDVLDRYVMNLRGQTSAPTPTLPRLQKAQTGEGVVYDDVHDQMRRMEILTQCIYGVDKDKQAIEVARLNLLLRALHRKEKLPMLANIREGDSLISGTPEELKEAFGKEWKEKKAFNWEKEFKEVFRQQTSEVAHPQTSHRQTSEVSETSEVLSAGNGFDVIIGNPPYIRAENMVRDERDHFINSKKFEVAYGRFDIHILFLEKAIKLLKEGGRLGFIIPYAGLSQNYGLLLRKFILENCLIETIVDLSRQKVFADASVATCIVILEKESNTNKRSSNAIKIVRPESIEQGLLDARKSLIAQQTFHETPNQTFRLELDANTTNLIKQIDAQSKKLGDLCYLINGAVLHDPKTGASKDRLIHSKHRKGFKRYIEAKEIQRYVLPVSTRFLDYRPKEVHRARYPELFETDKLLIARIASEIIATIDTSNIYTDHTINLAIRKDLAVSFPKVGISEDDAKISSEYDLRYMLGLMNSKIGAFYLQRMLGMALEINPETARQLPIRTINFNDLHDKARHDAIVNLVSEMLEKQKEFAEAEQKLEDARHALKRRIEEIDREIDGRVYELYGLTQEEIEIVEGRG